MATPTSTLHHFEKRVQNIVSEYEKLLPTHPVKPSVVRDIGQEYEDKKTLGQRAADGIASTLGSWRFLIIQSIILFLWILLNVVYAMAPFTVTLGGLHVNVPAWDKYPFILLNLMLSFQAAYATPVLSNTY